MTTISYQVIGGTWDRCRIESLQAFIDACNARSTIYVRDVKLVNAGYWLCTLNVLKFAQIEEVR